MTIEMREINASELFLLEPSLAKIDDPIISYCLVRVDCPDGASIGKLCAQTNHAGTQMTEELYDKNVEELNALYREWKEDRTFGTCLTLGVTAREMRLAVSFAKLLGLHANIIHDPTYPIRDGDQMITAAVDTCAYVFGRKSQCQPAVGQYSLLNESMFK